MPPQTPPRVPAASGGLRATYLAVYGALAAGGAALLSRPALLELRGLGAWGPALPWDVPLGVLVLLLFALLAGFTLRFALAAALGARPRLPEHAAFLALLASVLAVRAAGGPPAPGPDPAPALLAALRAAADAADAQYARSGAYALEEPELATALAALPAPGFRFRLRLLPLRPRVLGSARGPQLSPLPGDLPGTVYFAVSPDRSRCWLTALTLRRGQPALFTQDQRPVLLHARGGTHGAVGRDPLVPAYPSMRPTSDARAR